MSEKESSNKKDKIQQHFAKLSESVEFSVSSAGKEPATPAPKKKDSSN